MVGPEVVLRFAAHPVEGGLDGREVICTVRSSTSEEEEAEVQMSST